MLGQTVGKYRIVDRLGRGGMGTVYRAVDETLRREVAIKVLNAELNDPEIARRFRAEAVAIARLSHPGIAGIYELFEHEAEWLMVMEFVRGETLETLVNRMGPLSAQRAAELCMQTLAALAHAHSMGVVHRDLKPANLMITESGGVKVMDFGIARVSGSEHLTNAGFMMGTPAYMAPEQVRGGDIDARADLYALGVVFYRLTTAALPFKGDTAFAMVQSQVLDPPTPVGLVRPDLPPWVAEIIGRALAKAPEERFQSAAEFHEALARCLAGLPLSSMYASGDPHTTPGRPILAGAFQMRPMPTPMPMPGGPFQQSTANTGTEAGPGASAPMGWSTGETTKVLSPGTGPNVISGANDQTAIATPTPTASMAARAAAGAAGTTGGAPVKAEVGTPAGTKSKPAIALMVGAGIIVAAGGIAAVTMLRGGQSPELPQLPVAGEFLPPPATAFTMPPPVDPATEPVGPAEAAGSAAPSEPAARVATTPARTSTPGARTDATPAARGTSPAGSTAGASAGGAAREGAAGAPVAPATPAISNDAATPAGNDPLLTFPDVKLYAVTEGRNTDNSDALLNFAGGQLLVMPRSGGAAMATLPYRSITRATYVKARDPKWDPTLPGPPEGVDVGSFIRTSRHWLVLQGPDHYEILRLEDDNFARILSTIEERTGVKIDRPNGD